MDNIQGIIDVLSNGGRIWYEILTCELLLIDGDDTLSGVPITSAAFVKLKEMGQIIQTDYMRQGHAFFRRACVKYELIES